MDTYDPFQPPDPQQWMALDEAERMVLVTDYHKRIRVKLHGGRLRMHAICHTIVENQVALGDQTPVARTIQRLMTEGLHRHDALHAVGSVLAEHIFDLLKGRAPASAPTAEYFEKIEKLTAEGWRRGG